MPGTSPLPFIQRQIRAVLRTKQYSLVSDAQSIVEQTYALLALEDPDNPLTVCNRSDLAYTTATMLESTFDNAMVRFCLGLLLQLGPSGEILAAAYLRKGKISQESLRVLLRNMPSREQLKMVNRFFLRPLKSEPWLLKWGHDTGRALQGEDPDSVLLYLEALHEEADDLSNPLQRELLRGQFGVWLQRLLALELTEEQLDFMLRSAGKLGSHFIGVSLTRHLKNAPPHLLGPMLQVIGKNARKQDAYCTKAVLPFLKHPEKAVKLSALKALATMHAPQYPKALAYVYTEYPDLRRQMLLNLFKGNDLQFKQFFKVLPKGERRGVLQIMTGLLAHVAPAWISSTASRFGPRDSKDSAGWKTVIEALDTFIKQIPSCIIDPYHTPRLSRNAAGLTTESTTGSKVGGLVAAMKKTLEKHKQQEGKDKGQAFLDEIASLGKIEKRSYDNFSCTGRKITKKAFVEVDFGNLDLTGSDISSVSFTNCRFKHVEMDASQLNGVSFYNCTIFDLRIGYARLRNVSFEDCRLDGLHLVNSLTGLLRMDRCMLNESSLAGAKLEQFQVTTSSFDCIDFSYATLKNSRWEGLECQDCLFDHTSAFGSVIKSTTLHSCDFRDCRFAGLNSETPEFVQQEVSSIDKILQENGSMLTIPEAPPQLGGKDGLLLLYQLLDQLFFERDVRRFETLFLLNNSRRMDWANCMMGEPANEFLRMLPGIIASRYCWYGGKRITAPGCSITHYTPDRTVLGLLQKYEFLDDPSEPLTGELQPHEIIPVEALYTIGSTGTIAQAKSSDLDIWVCCEHKKSSKDQQKTLLNKLRHIETWAQERFDLEVHFFLMDLDDIRDNNFGFTDKESAGSTQAQLLKEEFYRTSIYIAGGKPCWWYMAPETDQKNYHRNFARLTHAVSLKGRKILDLGNLHEIPSEEFFGASLWQIVKALKSPFKSVMKLALLDKYMHYRDAGIFLCNRIKYNLFLEARDLWDIDPYAVMFREIFEYYKEIEQKDAQDIMRLAFLHKSGIYLAAQSTGRFYELQEYHYMEYFFPYSESDIASHVEPRGAKLDNEDNYTESYTALVKLGEKLIRYMFDTYNTIHGLWERLDLDTYVTQEDMTKLGRKVFSHLGQRPDKIMRVPFMDASKNIFLALEFSSEGLQGRPSVWISKGEPPKRKGLKSVKEEIRRDLCLERLLVWLVANGVYANDVSLQSASIEFPLSLPDIGELLKALSAFFPLEDTFEPDISENIRAEEVVKTFLIVNFTVAREEKRYTSAVIVYATNWGELFCVKDTKNIQLLNTSINAFIMENVRPKVSSLMDVEIFLPSRAQCPPLYLE